MKSYEGLTESDLKIIRMALQKLPITGGEALMIVNLLQKVEMEIDLLKIPIEDRPKSGDIIAKQ